MDFGRKLNQYMTLYRKIGNDFSGKPIVSNPELIPCRWSTVNELFYTNSGEEIYSKALIITKVLFNEGDLVVLGDTTSQPDFVTAGCEEVKRQSIIPNLSTDYSMYLYHV